MASKDFDQQYLSEVAYKMQALPKGVRTDVRKSVHFIVDNYRQNLAEGKLKPLAGYQNYFTYRMSRDYGLLMEIKDNEIKVLDILKRFPTPQNHVNHYPAP